MFYWLMLINGWIDIEFGSSGQIELNEKSSEGYEWIKMVLGQIE